MGPNLKGIKVTNLGIMRKEKRMVLESSLGKTGLGMKATSLTI